MNSGERWGALLLLVLTGCAVGKQTFDETTLGATTAIVTTTGAMTESNPTFPQATQPPSPKPSEGGQTDPTYKWSLWTGGTQLRGTNIYQRRVYPELDGPDFMGPGPIGPPYTQQDFDRLAALGANYVNISHPGLFTENPPYSLDPAVQTNLDDLLAMIARADMFAVISFRTGPGRSEFTFFWDEVGTWFDESYLNDSMWGDQAAQDAWVDMWRYTAQRYRDNPVVVGYDLMVEPNGNEVGSHALYDQLDIWDPAEFYTDYGGTLYDWNQLYPRISTAIRQVDHNTPILIGGMGYSAVEWLPYLQPAGDPRTVYMVHQYAPFSYTHQISTTVGFTYPGSFDADGDGQAETFDRAWLEGLLSPVDLFTTAHAVPVAVNEFGLVRWAPGAAGFMDDEMDLFEIHGLNYALWVWDPAWAPLTTEVDAFNFRHGPDPDTHADVPSSDLMHVITAHWGQNTIRPSSFTPATGTLFSTHVQNTQAFTVPSLGDMGTIHWMEGTDCRAGQSRLHNQLTLLNLQGEHHDHHASPTQAGHFHRHLHAHPAGMQPVWRHPLS